MGGVGARCGASRADVCTSRLRGAGANLRRCAYLWVTSSRCVAVGASYESIVGEQLTVLVTGAAGYVGSITSEQLLANGFEVIAIDNFQTGHRAAVLPDVVLFEGDFGSRELLERVFRAHKVDVVLHFAAETTIETSMADPGPYFQNNLVRGISLLDAMLKHGCRSLVFSSTAALFGEPVRTPIDEDHPAQPINPYGQSKLMFEQVLDWYHRCYGLRDRKSTRLNSSHLVISYAVFCLKKKK